MVAPFGKPHVLSTIIRGDVHAPRTPSHRCGELSCAFSPVFDRILESFKLDTMKICSPESFGGPRTKILLEQGLLEATTIGHSQRIVWKICREANDTRFPQLYTPEVNVESTALNFT